jgi:hypothetical protein
MPRNPILIDLGMAYLQSLNMRCPQLAILSLWILMPLASTAKDLSDWQTGAQITAPDEWKTTFTPPDYPGFGARSYDPVSLTSVDFTVDDQVTQEPLTEKSAFVQNFITNVENQNSVITGRQTQAVNGTSFLVLSISTKVANGTRYMTAWFAVVKGHTCQICLSEKNVDPGKNETLNKIIHSFAITDHVLPNSPVLSKQAQLDKSLKDNPFSFYGKVVDENGQPVPGATARISVQGELGQAQGSTDHNVQSDGQGAFNLEGVHAFGVIVTVSKDGYISIPDGHGPWNWLIGGAKPGAMPTADKPAIFHLQKKAANGH